MTLSFLMLLLCKQLSKKAKFLTTKQQYALYIYIYIYNMHLSEEHICNTLSKISTSTVVHHN